ncbi:hypothetical protein FRB98_001337 [Tulasnella sp. 332]|nr:hypothetical protein FRB98_001337 [Tulasnella sp. 332]
MSSDTSRLNYAQLVERLTSASAVPGIDDDGEEDEESQPNASYLKHLKQISQVVQIAESAKVAESISLEEYLKFLNSADETISSICSEAYEISHTDCIGVFAAPASVKQYVKTKKTLPFGPAELVGLEGLLANFADDVQARTGKTIKEIILDNGVAPPPWSTTARPSPHSTRQSRFTQEYDQDTIDSALNSVPADIRDAVQPILQASAKLQSNNILNPWGMAFGGNTVVVTAAGGWKERESCSLRFTIPSKRMQPGADANSDDDQQMLMESDLRTGFAGPFSELFVDSYAIWGAGDERIKAFDLTSGRLKHTLSCRGGYDSGAFGVHEEKIFRANPSGTFACWNRATLQTHIPSMGKASKMPAFGGFISEDHLGWLDGDEDVEMSRGQAPDSTFHVPNLKGPLGLLVNVPKTTKYLGTKETNAGGMSPSDLLGVRIFDIARPEAGASVVAVGFGADVACIRTHEDMPDMFVAAGSDPVIRIFDLRSPLPQMVLDGHSKDVTSCAIAPFGGQFPIIFTGGKDELVKAWDIRHTKTCLYELSAGTLMVQDLAWHEAGRTLFISGQNLNVDRMGNHHDYEELEEDDTGGESSVEVTYWPTNAMTGKDYFGKRWCSTAHALLEYRFKGGADANQTPAFEEPHMY